jgi:hypothetical protein
MAPKNFVSAGYTWENLPEEYDNTYSDKSLTQDIQLRGNSSAASDQTKG